ncbi:hypothetical protein GWO43_30640 [candidate division KSB1 bacterium]|nr:hypothetical protein [candidate division KSB1 bacterium]NIT75140.1 hypothetical protein [candidate division KSB1 bacterium]NIU28947.1 hypothetical protein [candidate division KSB1 bacterium]NIU91776.1 hypothetical protein [candidate division KSB1 bacterium]NIW22838.1 hypothetical protein [candidate division KSB1 bacterium]
MDKFEQEIENNISEYKTISDSKRKRIDNIIKKARERRKNSKGSTNRVDGFQTPNGALNILLLN